MILDRPTRSIRLLQTERTSEDSLQDKRRSSSLRGRHSKWRGRALGRKTTHEGGGGRGQRHNKKMSLHNFYPTLQEYPTEPLDKIPARQAEFELAEKKKTLAS